jgi:hypothetical protein
MSGDHASPRRAATLRLFLGAGSRRTLLGALVTGLALWGMPGGIDATSDGESHARRRTRRARTRLPLRFRKRGRVQIKNTNSNKSRASVPDPSG